MMDRFRDGLNGPLAWTFLAVIIVPFMFGGISSFLVSHDGDVVATVDGTKIRRPEYENLYQRMRANYGEMFAKIFDTEEKEREFRGQVMDMLVTQETVKQSLADLKLHVSHEHLLREVHAIPAFQQDGKFDPTVAQQRLVSAGLSPERFAEQMEEDLLSKQLQSGLTESAFVLPNETARFYQLEQEMRSGRFVRVPATAFNNHEMPEDAAVQSYYEAHRSSYQVPEKFSLQYLELKSENLQSLVSVNDEDIKAYYEQHKDDYKSAEKRKFAHILLSLKADEKGEKEASVRKQADDIAARLNKGEDFAQLAKQFSQDPITKDNGGELDVLEKGIMEPAFDTTAFALTKDKAISEPVRTQFGYEIVKLLQVMEVETLPLDQVKGNIETQLKRDRAADLFTEKQQQLEEKGFEVSDSLSEAAKVSGLTIQETGVFTRTALAPLAQLTGVMDVVLSDEVLTQRHNSHVVPVGEQHAVMLRVKDYTASNTKPLAEVRPEIVAALQGEAAHKAAVEWANTILARLRHSEDVSAELTAKNVSWESFDKVTRNSPAPEVNVRTQLFKLAKPAKDKPLLTGVSLSNGDFVIVQIDAVLAADESGLDTAKRSAYNDRLQRYEGETDFAGFIKWQKAQRKIERFDSHLNSKDAAGQP